MDSKKISIIIVDDHQLFAQGLKRIIEDNPDYTVVSITNNWEVLRLKLNATVPDLIMLDIQLKGLNGIEICTYLKKYYPFLKVILISMFENTRVIEEGKQANANGYIPKSTDASIVKQTIANVLNGIDSFIIPKKPEINKQTSLLSKREKEIIQLVKQGLDSKKIALTLHISKYTVDTHKKNILKKLNLKSTQELIAFAYQQQL